VNERQAKRVRRAMRAFIETDRKSMHPGPKADEAARTFGKQLAIMWPSLNHKQRGRVGDDIKGYRSSKLSWVTFVLGRPIQHDHPYNLARAVRTAIRFVTA